MKTKPVHFAVLFKRFADVQQRRLNGQRPDLREPAQALQRQLLSRFPRKSDADIMRKALADAYFPLGMLEKTLFADVTGMRFFISKKRPDMEPVLAAELLEWAAVFLSVRADIPAYFDPKAVTCIPIDGVRHPLEPDQWCSLCGICCQIGGVPTTAPPGVRYPKRWVEFLSGKALTNQQLCPFLFQYFGRAVYFCAIHNIKPPACRSFGREDCRKRLNEPNLHAS